MSEVLLKDLTYSGAVPEEDIQRFAKIWQPYSPAASNESEESFRRYFTQCVINPLMEQGGRCYEIFAGDEVSGEDISVGYVSACMDVSKIKIDIFVIESDRQRQGLGRAALIAMAELAEQENIGVIELQPLDSAIGFYERLGFVFTPNPYGVGIMSAHPDDILQQR